MLLNSPYCSLSTADTVLHLNPDTILAAATFHVRRMAAISMRTAPDRLPNILRCRQWSCIPYAYNCFGKDACVDSAILCVADRIRYLAGCPFSPVMMLRHYEKALRELQMAIDEPDMHNPQDVLAAVQLLAMYEMLDSLDGEGWAKHVAGAETMIRAYTSITPETFKKWEARGCGSAFPMLSDALLNGDAEFFRTYPWRELLWAVSTKLVDPPEGIRELLRCLRLLPGLAVDVHAAFRAGKKTTENEKFALLDRVHDLQYRMRSALRSNQLYKECHAREMPLSVDLFGAFLSGLVALDRMLESLRPTYVPQSDSDEDPTGELCAQLLQLEMSDSANYPPNLVLAGFQHAGELDAAYHTEPT